MDDVKAWREQVLQMAQKRDPAVLPLACSGALALRRQLPPLMTAPAAQAIGDLMVATALTWVGRAKEARPLLESAFAEFEKSPQQLDDAGYAAGLLAIVVFSAGEHASAIEWSERGVHRLLRPEGKFPEDQKLRLRLNHASLLSAVRRYDEARIHLLDLIAELNNKPGSWGDILAAAVHSVAISYQRQGRLAEAEDFNRQEIQLREATGAGTPSDLANAYQDAAVIANSQNRFDDAERMIRRALELFKNISSDPYAQQASALEALSDLQISRGNPEHGVATARQAVDVVAASKAVGPNSPRMARTLRRLSQAQLAAGDIAASLTSIRQALEIMDKFPRSQDVFIETAMRLQLARLHLALGAPDEALAAVDSMGSILNEGIVGLAAHCLRIKTTQFRVCQDPVETGATCPQPDNSTSAPSKWVSICSGS